MILIATLTNSTIDMLRELGLTGMASAHQKLETQTEARHLRAWRKASTAARGGHAPPEALRGERPPYKAAL
ncbi:hypothetical protein CPT32_28595 [Rhizobium sophoriradicis]|nr:hypothetical protein CPT32_28595 [Rhizobium sophoriradicis]PDS72438.1 hypothetical protein CO667_33345 [Rhizobium sp. L43]